MKNERFSIKEVNGKRILALYKTSWNTSYVSVDNGSTWVKTAAAKVAMQQTPESKWHEVSNA